MISWRSIVMVLWSVIWSVIGLGMVLADPRGKLYMYGARRGWSPQIMALGGVKVKVKGAERLDWSKTYVVCSNHQSLLDIPVLFASLEMPIRFLAKRSLFFIPLFGWSLFLARFIPVDRGRSKKARRSIDRAAQRVRRGPSLVVFPEGTRSPDGQVHPFKSGAFILGIKAGVPILPAAIRGTFQVISKDSFGVRPGSVELILGQPISTAGLTPAAKELLRKQVEQAVREMCQTGKPVASEPLAGE